MTGPRNCGPAVCYFARDCAGRLGCEAGTRRVCGPCDTWFTLLAQPQVAVTPQESSFACPVPGCQQTFPRRRTLLRHKRTRHHPVFVCLPCCLQFYHVAAVQGSDGEEQAEAGERRRSYSADRAEGGGYRCRFSPCEKTFPRKRLYLKHIKLGNIQISLLI